MSRSGYSYDYEHMHIYRANVDRAINGRRGQVLLRDLAAALDMMPDKGLIIGALECEGGVCALGALGRARGLDMSDLDAEDPEIVGQAFGVAQCMAAEIEFENDECLRTETPGRRWLRMRRWVGSHLREES